MYGRSATQALHEQAAEEAFSIAWHFIRNTHDVADEFATQTFLAVEIMNLLEQGERHKIALANRAITAYEHAHPDSIDHFLALGYIDHHR
ncbi:hypothetical protein [Bradyrhizobium sp. LHD-71]|uniref:hypothetical protein n=1 Tax=Bradyrhizobium sp. LHD-71 TaxID=3072141 RepID=UPI00280F63EB|nr:hypothetical protein [Bradyrhizobium sp. LHD-71]MDQ8729306.1 hypothetical protein [Bradyrhizobium sp. LHD-71]